MSNVNLFYVQECPTCGRRLQVRVLYLGKRVNCQHCRGAFIATDPANGRIAPSRSEWALQRADELLATAERLQAQSLAGS